MDGCARSRTLEVSHKMKRLAEQQASEPVFVIFNVDHEVESDDDEPPLTSDSSVVDVAHGVGEALQARGRLVEFIELRESTRPLAALASRYRRAVFFNMVESLGRDASREGEVPTLLARLGAAYTGNNGRTLKVALDKGRVNRLLEEIGVPVPRGSVVRSSADAVAFVTRRRLRFPLFVKPARLDASIAITQRSLVRDVVELTAQVDALGRDGESHIVVEEYMPGPECSVAICPSATGLMTAVSCIDFSSFPDHLAPILTYDCKWVEESVEYLARSVPAEGLLDDRSIKATIRAARRALRAIGAVGPARVDLRMDTNGQPRVLDINPNPDLDPTAGFARAMRARGVDYPALVDSLVEDAIRRHAHAHSTVSTRGSRRAPGAAELNTRVLRV